MERGDYLVEMREVERENGREGEGVVCCNLQRECASVNLQSLCKETLPSSIVHERLIELQRGDVCSWGLLEGWVSWSENQTR